MNPMGSARCSIFLSLAILAVAPPSVRAQSKPVPEWWSLKPLVRPNLPKLEAKWARNPIDVFILAKLREKGLTPSPEADARTLIRRLSYDLIGLPPTPAEVDTFLRDSTANPQAAYEKLVDRLLASPHYGERWARHWLDVVHYGDTHGYDKDKTRPNAWPYRDYVIRAFNEDRPYARFVQEQLAGDVLFPRTVDGIEALGFIAAGPWDFIGHAEVPETKTDGKIARHLDRDDMVANTMMTFASTTVQCAQCHHHKFDPISQEDYYSLQSVFAALDRADRKYYRDPEIAKKAAELETRKEVLLERKKEIDAKIAKALPELAALDRQVAASKVTPASGGERPEFGYHSALSPKQDVVKWVQIDLGKATAIDSIEFVGCHDTFNNIGAGFGFPVRFKIQISNDATFQKDTIFVLDQTKADVANPGVIPQRIQVEGKTARYVRFMATKLAPRMNDYMLALGEISVLDKDGKNLALGAEVSALDSIEAPPRWRKSNLVDGYYFGKNAKAPLKDLAALTEKRKSLLKTLDAETRSSLADVTTALTMIDLVKLPPPSVVYCGTVHNGSGAFSGTGASGGKPRSIFLLKRGDVTQPLSEVAPAALSSIKELPGRFNLPPDHSEGDRRAALAKWLTDPKNPLTWRSIVNRVWRYHIGRGIVESPNDFGKMGQLPTHPELLDFLAFTFREDGGSMKKLHKLIVTSATYRQMSKANETAEKIDADNAFYWRMNRRRLEAEAIHDSVLFVSGKLHVKLYGPAFQDFVIEKPEHSPHYQYHLHDPEDPKTHRRSIYRFLVRSQQQPFMTTLDCADPSMQVDKRNETLSALQALALLNNGFMLSMSKHFAQRVEKIGADEKSRIIAAMRWALAREPNVDELKLLTDFSKKHGMANACRAILNLNEFVFVD